jgi:branched-chain amino acid transport system substrate-binding protein
MKKTIVIVAIVLVMGAPQFISLHQFSDVRQWMAGRSVSEWVAGRASTDVLIGVAWPFAINRDGMEEGLRLGQEEINARWGPDGRRIVFEMRDDEMDGDRSRAIALEFARTPRMAATLGYYDDQYAVRASMIFEESQLLHVVAGANNTYMTTHGFKYLIRSALANDRVGPKLAHLCYGLGYRTFAMIGEDGPFGDDLAYQIGTELDVMDATVIYQSSFVAGHVDFRDKVNELKQVGADVIIFVGVETESALFIKTARSLGLQTPIVGSFNDTPEMHRIAGPALEGVMFYEVYDVDAPTVENQAFVASYQRRFGRPPAAQAAQGYDAVQIVARAVDITGSTNALDLADAIRSMDRWQGANGSYKFDANGELEDKDILLKVYGGDGQPAVLASSGSR